MAEAQARGRARRLPSERAGEDDRLGLLGAAEAGRAGLDAASLGRANSGPDAAPLRDARGARAGRTTRRPVRARARGRPGTRICLKGIDRRGTRARSWASPSAAE